MIKYLSDPVIVKMPRFFAWVALSSLIVDLLTGLRLLLIAVFT